ncbi:LemA family protein [Zooshikella marina]|uniref:LemA family protein n=1 Tax=Zooshikella ganghwensis TaxID=202772 RepID=A0A4P9VMY6_9GAMM|nr:LemA family protein [Zooshikella ganghwensis]MBU2709097.1 LemA family protein [Zooshikella ganghwensis]RDH43999.1 LemA family protein [Zooshikella ganghwensis]
MDISTIIILVVVIGSVVYVISIYNNLVSKRNTYKNAFAQIEVQLKRRYDLIPNLIETAKGYMQHEQQTLTKVIEARNAAANMLKDLAQHLTPDQVRKFSEAEQTLTGAMGQFNVVVENYPDLKANQNMMQFAEELTSTENKVSRARQFYNDAVTDYNNFRQSFPPVFFANMFGHSQDAGLLEFEDSAAIQQAPKVSF